jgi:hypothetical protein
MKHHVSTASAAATSARALAVALLLAAPVAFAQTDAAKPMEAGSKGVATVQVPDADKAPSAQPVSVSVADGQQPQMAEASGEEEFEVLPLEVGDATLNLLAWQRSGQIASTTPRPIAGSVANRSYERYLKSFEYPIPERLTSTVSKSSGADSGNSSGGR